MIFNFNFREIISAFMVLFAIIDITGSIPIILDLKAKGGKIKPLQTVFGSLAVFIVFLFAGDGLLALFGVDIESFAVAGSILIFILAIEMLLGIEIIKSDGPSANPTIVPLIFPLIAGAGTLTTLLTIRAEFRLENIIVALILNMIFVYLVLAKLKWIEKIFGKSIIYILRKFFGIILLAIAIKLFITNVASIVTMFK